MEQSFVEDLRRSASNPHVKGLLCADSNGLLISANGEMNGNHAGRYTSISRTAASLDCDQPTPTVIIETPDRKYVVKDYGEMTIALKCSKNDE